MAVERVQDQLRFIHIAGCYRLGAPGPIFCDATYFYSFPHVGRGLSVTARAVASTTGSRSRSIRSTDPVIDQPYTRHAH